MQTHVTALKKKDTQRALNKHIIAHSPTEVESSVSAALTSSYISLKSCLIWAVISFIPMTSVSDVMEITITE